MGHVILLSELERARPSRLRDPLPEGGATISLFLGVRYERWDRKHESLERGSLERAAEERVSQNQAVGQSLVHQGLVHEVL
jgi:hypothetical protein